MTLRHGRHRTAAWLVYAGIAVFASFMIAAMQSYAGGTFFDRTLSGHRFWTNFWCDLRHQLALNGASNTRAARLSALAMLGLAGGLAPFWWLTAAQLRSVPRLRRGVCWLGLAGACGMACVVFLPSDAFPRLHGSVATLAGLCGIIAAALAMLAFERTRSLPRALSVLGLLVLLTAAATLLQYLREFFRLAPASPLLPALQKLATLLFLGWVLVVTLLSQRSTARPAAPGRSESPEAR